ncbi:DUF5592 family protein [Bacillus sp. BP-3]|uniref:DUF5592 family protein n=1 Tax=Bacillus sp. BP-3 TaxID=3022773 RepID=UPI00232B4202|nr:DUF5592 family protein [Bacillus sp. BP-3]MDC2867804.1 DUF5592 family protein [Bacillus sp. BP-3]
MANYRIPKEIRTELKINKVLYLFDLLFLIGLIVFTMITKTLIHPMLQIPYYIFMLVIGIALIVRPNSNPQKRMYEALIIAMTRKRSTYCAIDQEQD